MTTSKFNVGQAVKYQNGNPSIYTGIIVSVRPFGKTFSYVIIDDAAGMKLRNAGYAIGSDIQESQILNTYPVS